MVKIVLVDPRDTFGAMLSVTHSYANTQGAQTGANSCAAYCTVHSDSVVAPPLNWAFHPSFLWVAWSLTVCDPVFVALYFYLLALLHITLFTLWHENLFLWSTSSSCQTSIMYRAVGWTLDWSDRLRDWTRTTSYTMVIKLIKVLHEIIRDMQVCFYFLDPVTVRTVLQFASQSCLT